MRFLIGSILFLFIQSICFAQNNPTKFEKVKWSNTLGVDTTTTKIKKNSPSGWGNSGALSENYIESEMKGELLFIADDVDGKYALGLSKANIDNHFNTIEFGFYFLGNGKFRITESGNFKIAPTNFLVGDEFSIKRAENAIKYFRNGIEIPIQSSIVSLNENLYADISFFDNDAFVIKEKVKIKHRKPILIEADITGTPCDMRLGSISLTISGGVPPYEIVWGESTVLGEATNLLVKENLEAGEYLVTVTDVIGNIVQKTLRVGVDIEWINLVNVNSDQNSLSKTSSTSSKAYDAGASSSNILNDAENGWIEYTVDANISNLTFGFSNADHDISPSSISYAFQISKKELLILQNGTVLAKGASIAANDILLIKKEDMDISFYLNDIYLYKIENNYSALLLDVSLKDRIGEYKFKTNFCPYRLENSLFCWARNAKAEFNDESKAIVTDDKGNSYVTGYYETATIDFDGTVLSSPSNTINRNLFLTKYGPNGEVIWAKRIYSEGGNSEGLGISLAFDEHYRQEVIFLTGYFTLNLSFPEISTSLSSRGGEDVFYAAFKINGDPIWAGSAGSENDDRGQGISTISTSAYITGFSSGGRFYYGNEGRFLSGEGGKDAFVLHFDTFGPFNILNAYTISGKDDDEGKSISAAVFGATVTGYFTNNLTYPNSIIGGGGKDLFITKIKVTGGIEWINSAGDDKDQVGNSVCTDNLGQNIYVAGYYYGNITFSTTVRNIGQPLNSNAFIVKYNPSGTPLWTQNPIANGGDEQATSIAIDRTNQNIYVTGFYSTNLMMSGVYSVLPNYGNKNVFVLKLTLGNIPKLFLSAGKQFNEIAYGISTDQEQNIYLTGSFNNQSKFGNIELLSANNNFDLFIAKICKNNICQTNVKNANGLVICPGGFRGVELIEMPNITRNVYQVGTQTIYTPPFTNYTWTPSSGMSFSNNQLTVSPSITTNYNVTATNFNGCVSNFSVLVKVVSDENNFAKLKSVLDGGYYVMECSKNLRIQIEEEYYDNNLRFQIFNSTGTDIVPLCLQQNPIVTTSLNKGNSYISIDVSNCHLNQLIRGNFYVLKAFNSKNEAKFLRFYYNVVN